MNHFLQCTAKMKQYIPGRCHTYEGDKSIGQGGIGIKSIAREINKIYKYS